MSHAGTERDDQILARLILRCPLCGVDVSYIVVGIILFTSEIFVKSEV